MVAKSKKRVFEILLAILIIFVFSTVITYAVETSNYLEVNREYKISSLEKDYISGYSFYLNVPTDGRVRFTIDGCNEIIYEELFIDNGDGTRSGRQWNISGDRLDSGWISVTAGQKDMKLSAEQGCWADDETLYIEFETHTNSFGDIESNDTLETAQPISFGEMVEGNFSGKTGEFSRTDIDCYVVETKKSGSLDIDLINCDNPEYVIPFTVYSEDENGNYEEMVYVWDKNYLYLGYETINAPTKFRLRVPEGRYYFKLEVDWKESSEYNLTVNFTEESASAYEQEKNNSSRTANQIDFGTKYTGNFNDEKDVDWYKFEIPANGTIKLNFWNPANIAKNKIEVTLYDKNLKEIVSKKATVDKYFKTDNKSVSEGTYYVRVKSLNDGMDSIYDYKLRAVFRCKSHVFDTKVLEEADYGKKGLKISTCEVCHYEKEEVIPALKLKKTIQNAITKYSSSKVKISWKDVKDEDGYQIYRMTNKNGSYSISKKYTTTKSYMTMKVKKGKTYYYKVRAYKDMENGRVYAPWSGVKAFKL